MVIYTGMYSLHAIVIKIHNHVYHFFILHFLPAIATSAAIITSINNVH